jgi:hypothetical protein
MRPYLSAGNRTYGQSSYFAINPARTGFPQDVVALFAPTFVSTQAMIEKVTLPINLGVLRSEALPTGNNICHLHINREAGEEMNMGPASKEEREQTICAGVGRIASLGIEVMQPPDSKAGLNHVSCSRLL